MSVQLQKDTERFETRCSYFLIVVCYKNVLTYILTYAMTLGYENTKQLV